VRFNDRHDTLENPIGDLRPVAFGIDASSGMTTRMTASLSPRPRARFTASEYTSRKVSAVSTPVVMSLQTVFLDALVRQYGREGGGWAYTALYVGFWWLVLAILYVRRIYVRL